MKRRKEWWQMDVGDCPLCERGNIASPKSPSENSPQQPNAPKDVQSCASECTHAATQTATSRPRLRGEQ